MWAWTYGLRARRQWRSTYTLSQDRISPSCGSHVTASRSQSWRLANIHQTSCYAQTISTWTCITRQAPCAPYSNRTCSILALPGSTYKRRDVSRTVCCPRGKDNRLCRIRYRYKEAALLEKCAYGERTGYLAQHGVTEYLQRLCRPDAPTMQARLRPARVDEAACIMGGQRYIQPPRSP